jgi:tetratricopeptide (TPR) repeat protein/predicted Ser/Thr protein kinase
VEAERVDPEEPFDRVCEQLCRLSPRNRLATLGELAHNERFPRVTLAELNDYFRFGHDRRDIIGLLGHAIDGYQVLDVIGRGGSSVVYLVESQGGAHQYALKLLDPEASPAIRRFFESEAPKLEAVQMPGIVRLYARGTFHGSDGLVRPYLVTEVVHGLPLDQYAARYQLGFRARCELALTVCDTLSRVYLQHALVHLDLKPENVLVSQLDGQPRLIDFGIARRIDPARIAPESVEALTPGYASPEQLDPERFGAPSSLSDQYSLALMLLELLGGRRATGSSRSEEPFATPPRPKHPELGREVWAVIERALRARPDERYADLSTFASELRRALVRSAEQRRKRHALKLVAAALLGAGALVGAERATRPLRSESVNRDGRRAQDGGRRDAALLSFQRARELDPKNETAIYNGAVAAEDVGDLTSALRAYSAACDAAEDPIPALNNLGRAFILAGQAERAVPRLEEGLARLGAIDDTASAETLLRSYRLHKNLGWAELTLAREHALAKPSGLVVAEQQLRLAIHDNERLRALDVARDAHGAQGDHDAAAYCLLAEVLTERSSALSPEIGRWWHRCASTSAHSAPEGEAWKLEAASYSR